jgi:hypothetical protein
MRSDLQTATRVKLTDYVGIEGEWDWLKDFAAAPDGHSFVSVGCWNYILGSDTFGFCGIRPGGVKNAITPDWQPRP